MSGRPTSADRAIAAAAGGGGILALGQLFEMVSRIGVALVLTNALGADGYGLYVVAISVATVVAGLSTLGLDRSMIRYVAILSGRRDDPGVWGTLQVGVVVAGACSALLGIATYVAAGPIARSIFDQPDLVDPLRLMAVVVPFLTLSNVLRGVAHGFRKMGVTVLAENIVQTIVRLGLLLLFVALWTLDTIVALAIFGAADLAAALAMIVLLGRIVPYEKENRVAARRDVREIVGFALPLWLSSLLRQFRRNLEILLLGALSAASSVAVFAVASRVTLIGRVAYLSLLSSVKPLIAELYDQGERTALGRLYVTATRWTFSFSLPFFILVVFLSEPILELFGGEFVSGRTALLVLAGAELVNAGTGICGSLIDMTGHVRLKLANSVVWFIVQVGGGALLIPRYDALGAAFAVLAALTVVNVATVVQMGVLEQLWPYDRSFLKPLSAGLASAGAGLALIGIFGVPDGLVGLALHAVVIGAVYAGTLIALGFDPDDRVVLDRLRNKVAGRRKRPAESAEPAQPAEVGTP